MTCDTPCTSIPRPATSVHTSRTSVKSTQRVQGHQNVIAALLELLQRPFAQLLTLPAVKCSAFKLRCHQHQKRGAHTPSAEMAFERTSALFFALTNTSNSQTRSGWRHHHDGWLGACAKKFHQFAPNSVNQPPPPPNFFSCSPKTSMRCSMRSTTCPTSPTTISAGRRM